MSFDFKKGTNFIKKPTTNICVINVLFWGKKCWDNKLNILFLYASAAQLILKKQNTCGCYDEFNKSLVDICCFEWSDRSFQEMFWSVLLGSLPDMFNKDKSV